MLISVPLQLKIRILKVFVAPCFFRTSINTLTAFLILILQCPVIMDVKEIINGRAVTSPDSPTKHSAIIMPVAYPTQSF